MEPSKTYAEVLHEEEVTAMIETRVAFFAVQKGGGAEVGGWAWGRENACTAMSSHSLRASTCALDFGHSNNVHTPRIVCTLLTRSFLRSLWPQ